MLQSLRALNGPQTMGNGRAFWGAFGVVLLLAVLYPLGFDPYDVGNTAYFMIWIFAALGLSLMWGYTGLLSFGQMAFFGVAGYGYGVISINLAAAGGMTLLFATTLALAAFMGQTAGPEWAIGRARFNGFNGMGGMPPLELPWFGGPIPLEGTVLYYAVLIAVELAAP